MDEGNRTTRENSTVIRTYPSFGREAAGLLFKTALIVGSIIFVFGFLSFLYEDSLSISDGTCNIAVLPVEGVIWPYDVYTDAELIITPRSVRTFLSDVEADDSILGVLVEINSPGGTPVASEQIAEQLADFDLPVVGVVGDIALSGGYLVAASTDHLIASPMSDVGSIGVTMSYVQNTRQNEEEGLDFVELTSAPFKEAGNPNRELTDEEKAMFQEDLDLLHEIFTQKVADYRGIEINLLRELADGSTYTGVDGLTKGLVDALGGRREALSYFSEQLELAESELSFCEYTYPSYLPI